MVVRRGTVRLHRRTPRVHLVVRTERAGKGLYVARLGCGRQVRIAQGDAPPLSMTRDRAEVTCQRC